MINAQRIKNIFSLVRAIVMRCLKPKNGYVLLGRPKRSVQPISDKYGFDRGTPVDRYYIQKFLEDHVGDIKGRVLEVCDNTYTLRYGGSRVLHSDVLDIDKRNKSVTIHGDLRNLENIQSDSYDCLLVTQTFGLIDDYDAAVRECWRILKQGGVLISTFSGIGPFLDVEEGFWRFTPNSVRYVFGKCFDATKMTIKIYGNVLSGQCYWVGLASEELTSEELDYNDPRFPVVIGLRVQK